MKTNVRALRVFQHHLQYNSNTSLPLNQHPGDKGLCSYTIFLGAQGDTIEATSPMPQRNGVFERSGQALATKNKVHAKEWHNTPEEAIAPEMKRKCALIQNINREEGTTVAEVESQRAQIQDGRQQYTSSFLKEDKLSTTAGASSMGANVSSPGPKHYLKGPKIPHQGPGCHHQRLEYYRKKQESILSAGATASTSPEAAPATSPRVEPSTSTGVAPDIPHYRAAGTRPNPSIEDAFDSTHAKEASGAKPHHVCGFRLHRYITIICLGGSKQGDHTPQQSTKMPPAPRSSVSFENIGTSASGITGESKFGIRGVFASGITGSTPFGIIGPSAGLTSSVIAGAPTKKSSPEEDGPTRPASSGVVPATYEPCLTRASIRAEPNKYTNCQLKGTHILTDNHGRTPAQDLRDRHGATKSH